MAKCRIFFCSSKAHARRVEEVFDKLYPQYAGELAKVLVSDDPRVYGKGGLLDQFTNNDMPRIAISVDMLDTGIDIREIVNLVFVKPVYSYTKFWQMIGRGTRLLETNKPKPWCLEKDVFLILDCWDNFENFKLKPKGKQLAAQLPLPVRLVGLRFDKIEKAIDRDHHQISEREIGKLRRQIAELPQNSIVIKDSATSLSRLAAPDFWTTLDHQKLEFLRNEIKPLFRTVSEADFKAMRFERDVVEYSLAKLSDENEKAETLKDGIVEQISELPLSIPFVQAEEPLIRASQASHFWSKTIALDFEDSLDELIGKLGPLMKFREANTGGGPTHLDLQDYLHHKEWVEFGPQNEAISISRYREMVEALIAELTEFNPVLLKIKNGEAVSADESNELANLLHTERYPDRYDQVRITLCRKHLSASQERGNRLRHRPSRCSLRIRQRVQEPASTRTCRDSGHFVRFIDSPLDFVTITTDTFCNTLAAPLADRATSPLDDVHQGRVIFLRSFYLRLVHREKPL